MNWGGTDTYYKQTNAGTGIVDYELNRNSGIVVNSSGYVKVASSNTSTTATWSNVTVGGSTTGNVAVAISDTYQMVLKNTGALYVSSRGSTTMTDVVFSATTATSRGGIVDFAMGRNYQYVLFGNGALYGGLDGDVEASMALVASNIKMFDYEGGFSGGYVYTYNTSNQIQVASQAGAGTHTFTTLKTVTNVAQIRGAYYSSSRYSGWGYLTTSGALYTSTTATGTTMTTRASSGVAYIDCGIDGTWGYLNTSGQMYLWYTGSSSYVATTSTSPTLKASLGTSAVPNLDGQMSTIADAPPAERILPLK